MNTFAELSRFIVKSLFLFGFSPSPSYIFVLSITVYLN